MLHCHFAGTYGNHQSSILNYQMPEHLIAPDVIVTYVTTPHTPVTPPIHLIPATSAAHAGWGEVSHQMVFVQQLR